VSVANSYGFRKTTLSIKSSQIGKLLQIDDKLHSRVQSKPKESCNSLETRLKQGHVMSRRFTFLNMDLKNLQPFISWDPQDFNLQTSKFFLEGGGGLQ
jgi:hypothetical protein